MLLASGKQTEDDGQKPGDAGGQKREAGAAVADGVKASYCLYMLQMREIETDTVCVVLLTKGASICLVLVND